MLLFLKTLPLIIGMLIVQLTLVPFIAIYGIAPDLLLIVVVWRSLQADKVHGVTVGFLSGFLQDLTGSGVVGVFAFTIK